MAIGGDGPWVVAVMWSLTAIGIVFVALRIYTRVVVVKSFGVDDHVYNLAFVSNTHNLAVIPLTTFNDSSASSSTQSS
jgi:hypothetical protein